MLLIRKQSSLPIVVVLYLQVFASPFHKYYQRCSDCQTILEAQTGSRGPQAPARPTSVRTREPQVGRNKLNGTGDYIATAGAPSSETIIVSDQPAPDGPRDPCKRLASVGPSQGDGAAPMLCVDYRKCPSILKEASSRIRLRTCGIQPDGSIRVCCSDADASSLSAAEMEVASLIVTLDERLETDDNDNPPPDAAPNITGATQKAGRETLIVTGSQQLSTDNERRVATGPGRTGRRGQSLAGPLTAAARSKGGPDGAAETSPEGPGRSRFLQACGRPRDGENSHHETRIIGGKSAGRNAWPWFALIMVRSGKLGWRPECGATLISTRHVLTAAHCVLDGSRHALNRSELLVRLAEFDLSQTGDGETDFGVDQITAHSQFNFKTFKNDIALIKLHREVTFNETIMPACLPHDEPRLASQTPGSVENQTAWVLGFGQTSYNGRTSDQLLQADLRIVQQTKCKRAFSHLVRLTRDYVCASSQTNDHETGEQTSSKIKDSCQGDSGGPLMMLPPRQSDASRREGDANERWYLYGIVSFGYRCASAGFPGVYTRVNRYLNWIESNMV